MNAGKVFYFDCETTGLDEDINGIIQMGGIIEIDGEVKETINYKVRPFPQDRIDASAVASHGISTPVMQTYDHPEDVYKKLIATLGKYVVPRNPKDKFQMVAYNGRFDDDFLRAWFRKHGDKYYGSWFSWPTIDPTNLFATVMLGHRHKLENFKLVTVAQYLGIDIDLSKAHDALYDTEILREVFLRIKKMIKIEVKI